MSNGLLINYEFCTGCHTCEVACKKAHNLPEGQWGIKLMQDGPRKNIKNKWEFTYLPLPTNLCDLCVDRTAIGKLPNCVHHCQAGCMEFGPVEELSKIQNRTPRCAVFTPLGE